VLAQSCKENLFGYSKYHISYFDQENFEEESSKGNGGSPHFI
jgi:hypothetical protein